MIAFIFRSFQAWTLQYQDIQANHEPQPVGIGGGASKIVDSKLSEEYLLRVIQTTLPIRLVPTVALPNPYVLEVLCVIVT